MSALQPSANWMWMRTGRRRITTRLFGSCVALLAGYISLGPSSATIGKLPPSNDNPMPTPVASTGIYPDALTESKAEQLLGAPLLDSRELRGAGKLLGYWGKSTRGAFGATSIVFQVYYTPLDTWLTITQIQSEMPSTDTPFEQLMTQPVAVQGTTGRLFHSPGMRSVDWHVTQTLWAIFSEQVPGSPDERPSSGWIDKPLMDTDRFLMLANSLGPRGTHWGPFTLAFPW